MTDLMAGGPELRNASRYSSVRPWWERLGNAALDYGPIPAQALTGLLMQPVTAGKAVGEAAADPTLPNLTNAGVNTAMALFQPMKAAAIAGAGLGAAGLQQWMPDLLSAASAADGLTEAQVRRMAELQRKIDRGDWKSGAERRAVEAELADLRRVQTEMALAKNKGASDAAAAQKAAEQAEYNRQVDVAEQKRKAIEGTDTSFRETPVGKVYDKLGGLTPMVAGVAGGMLGRMAHGGGSAIKNYGIPAAEGTGAAFATTNAPLFYDSFSTPTLNPKKEALATYAQELPPNHPRKQEMEQRAQAMPYLNPVQQAARDELFSPGGTARRAVASAIEGGLGGITGGAVPKAVQRGLEGVGEIPGTIMAGYHRGMNRASAERALGQELADSAAQRGRVQSEALRRSDAPEAIASGPAAAPAPPSPQPPLPAPSQNQSVRALPDPTKSDWPKLWSKPGQDVVAEYITANPGAPLSALKAPQFVSLLADKLPPGAALPAPSTARGYLQRLNAALPEKPTVRDMRAAIKKNPGLFAVPGAVGGGLMLIDEPSTMSGLLPF